MYTYTYTHTLDNLSIKHVYILWGLSSHICRYIYTYYVGAGRFDIVPFPATCTSVTAQGAQPAHTCAAAVRVRSARALLPRAGGGSRCARRGDCQDATASAVGCGGGARTRDGAGRDRVVLCSVVMAP